MKRRLSLLLAVVMILGSFSFAFADEGVDVPAFLEKEGILKGNSAGDLMLDEYLERKDAVVLLARLLDREEEAEAFEMEGYPTYDDLKGNPYYDAFLGWAEYNEYFVGVSETSFGYEENLEAVQYAIVLLRALGYGNGDRKSEWEEAWDLAEELGLLENVEVERRDEILRSDVAQMTFNALGVTIKGSDETLAEFLGIEMPEEPKPEDLEVVDVYTENLREVIVELSNAELADEEDLVNVNNYRMVNRTVEKVTLDGDKVIVLLDHADALTEGKEYEIIVRGIDKDVNGTYDFVARDKEIPEVVEVEVLGEYGIKVTTSEPVRNPRERNFLIDGKNIAMDLEQYGRDIILTPYHSTSFPEDAETLTIKELVDYEGFRSEEIEFDIEIVKDEVAPEVVDVIARGRFVEVVFDKDIYEDSLAAYYNRSNVGNISYKLGRHEVYAEDVVKVDTNRVVYEFEEELPRRTDVTIVDVQNHSKVKMEETTMEARVIVDDLEPELIDNAIVASNPDEGTLTIRLYFDKDVYGSFINEEDVTEGFVVTDHFRLYEREVLRRNISEDGYVESASYVGTRRDVIDVRLAGLTVYHARNNDLNYILEILDFEDVYGNRMYRDYVDFRLNPRSAAFEIVDVYPQVIAGKTEITITFTRNKAVDRILGEDLTNYLFTLTNGVKRDVKELGGDVIVEADGNQVTIILPDWDIEDFTTLEVLQSLKDKDGRRLTGARIYDFDSGELLEEGETPEDKAKEAEDAAIEAILEAENIDALYSALIAAGIENVRIANIELYKAEIDAIDPEEVTLEAIQAAINAVNDRVDESQLIFDINRINGEGNMSEKLAELEVEAYDELTEIQKVEVAKLFIETRGETPAETATEDVVREDYDSIEKIVNKLNVAITDYKSLLEAVNNATTLDDMKIALTAAGATETGDELTILANAVLNARPEGGYTSFTQILTVIE